MRILYLPEIGENRLIIKNAITTILNLTGGSSKCNKMFILYDRKCGLNDQYQLFSWVYNTSHRLMLEDRNLDNYERLDSILTMLKNLLSSDDHDI